MKHILFIPGMSKTRDYSALIELFHKHGYSAEKIPINWERTTLDDWISQVETVYNKHNPKNTILAGFSYGALTALAVASRRNPFALWLFSLSPCFASDITQWEKSWIIAAGKRRIAAFTTILNDKILDTITCPTKLFIGEKEADQYPLMQKRMQLVSQKLTGGKIYVAPGCEHDVVDPRYLQTISSALK